MSDKRQKRKQSRRERKVNGNPSFATYGQLRDSKEYEDEELPIEELPELEKEVGEKCDEPMAYSMPYGGVTSFADYDAYLKAQESTDEAYDLVNVFNSIIQNIIASDVPNKSATMAQAAKEFQSRIQGLDMKEAGGKVEVTQAPERDEKEKIIEVSEKPGFVVGVQNFVRSFLGLKDGEPESVYDFTSSLSSLKSKDGKTMLMLHTTNAFKDRDREIFADKALQEYAEKSAPGSPVDYWHTDWNIGRVVWTGYGEKTLFELVEPADNQAVKELVSKIESNPGYWGTSHRFHFDAKDKQNGVFTHLVKSKSTVLPIHAAANPFTAVAAVGKKENNMNVNPQKLKELEYILSPEAYKQAAAFIAGEENKAAGLVQAGVEHKEVAVPDPTPPPAPVVQTATPVAQPVTTQTETPVPPPATPDVTVLAQALQAALTPLTQRLEQLEQKEKARSELPRAAALFQSQSATRSSLTAIPEGALAGVGPGEKSIEPEDMMITSLRQALGGAALNQ